MDICATIATVGIIGEEHSILYKVAYIVLLIIMCACMWSVFSTDDQGKHKGNLKKLNQVEKWMKDDERKEKMRLFGYEKDGEDCLELKEATILCSIDEIDSLIQFLEQTRMEFNTVDKNAYDGVCHNHYRDYIDKWSDQCSDIIIYTDFSKESDKGCAITCKKEVGKWYQRIFKSKSHWKINGYLDEKIYLVLNCLLLKKLKNAKGQSMCAASVSGGMEIKMIQNHTE